MNKTIKHLLAAAGLALLGSVHAAGADLSEAEVRKVDKAAGKITLKHGEIKSLQMPPMTMVFGVASPALLDQVKPGDQVRFRAVDEGGKLTVVELQKTQ